MMIILKMRTPGGLSRSSIAMHGIASRSAKSTVIGDLGLVRNC